MPEYLYIPPEDHGLDIIHQDTRILIINKPAGLLSVPGKGADKQDCQVSRVQREFPSAEVVHRLDMATSGLMIFALDKATQSQLSKLFQQRQIHKKYIAIVHGMPAEASGTINLPLITDWPNRPRQMVDMEKGKPSKTCYRVLETDLAKDITFVELIPVTGRTHQLRVHMMSIGTPIIGDRLYGRKDDSYVSQRLMLHASELEFVHPYSGELLKFELAPAFEL